MVRPSFESLVAEEKTETVPHTMAMGATAAPRVSERKRGRGRGRGEGGGWDRYMRYEDMEIYYMQ